MNKKLISRNGFSKIIFGVWIGIILMTLFTMKGELIEIFAANQRYVRLLELVVILAVICEGLFFRKVFHKWSDAKKGLVIFMIALGVRLICLFLSEEYVPTSDFNNYFLGACHFAQHGFAGGAYKALESYGLPSFAGQAVLNGFMLRILSPTLLGMQILNALYTSGICLMIFVTGKRVSEKASLIGAVFYTFYPCNILASQVTTNHHGAAFFILLCVYFFFNGLKEEKIRRRVLDIIISAVCLVASNYYHPSALIVLCAFGAYMFIQELGIFLAKPSVFLKELWKDIKRFTGVFSLTVALLILYCCIYGSTITIIKSSGYYTSKDDFPLLGKFVLGFNFEYGGSYNAEDGKYILSFPKEERAGVCFDLIAERIKAAGVRETLDLILQKNRRAWFGGDNYFSFYQSGIQKNLTEKIEKTNEIILKAEYETQQQSIRYIVEDIADADSLFVLVIWFFSFIGIIRILLTYKDDNLMYMLMYIPLGWMLFIMLTEMQPRYRYQGMTVIILLAGFGAETFLRIITRMYRKVTGSFMKLM